MYYHIKLSFKKTIRIIRSIESLGLMRAIRLISMTQKYQKNLPRSTNKAASKQVQSYACVYSAEREQIQRANAR